MKRPRPAARGFSLVETVVALAILSIALLATVGMLAQQPRIRLQLRAHQEAHAALGEVSEGLRAGTVAPVSGRVPLLLTPDAADGLAVWLEVEPDPAVPGLSRVTATARYTVRGQLLERRVETMIWRKP